jgi:hypothetical protein
MISRVVTALVLAATLWVSTAAADEQRKVALVVGNSAYPNSPLRNPVNDARAMAQSLRDKGFEVLLRENTSKSQLEAAIADFGEKLSEDTIGLFYYAGHGMQLSGRNYLIPVDAKFSTERRVRLEAVDMEVAMEQMSAAKTKVSMVIIDACRDNPFERSFRSSAGGLSQVDAPQGTFIAYATAPGRVAADGDGEHGVYTQELLKAINKPGAKIEEIFKAVRINVTRITGGGQLPWEASSLTGDFVFTPRLERVEPGSINADIAAQQAQIDAQMAELRRQQDLLAKQGAGRSPIYDLQGSYAATIEGFSQMRTIAAVLTVEGYKITGFGIGATALPCRLIGSVQQMNANFTINCDYGSAGPSGAIISYAASFTGAFAQGPDGKYVLKSKFVMNDKTSGDVTWVTKK